MTIVATLKRSLSCLPLLALAACLSPPGATPQERIDAALQLRDDVLAEFSVREPEAHERLTGAAGYLVGSGFHVHPGAFTLGNAYYLVVDNESDEVFHGNFLRLAVGPGIAIKSFRFVVVFDEAEAVRAVMGDATAAGYLAEAAFRFGDFGGSSSLFGPVGTEAYLWTETGFALEAAVGVAFLGEDGDRRLEDAE